jgi:DNA-binding transcriptional regulator YhcF (GntR family)
VKTAYAIADAVEHSETGPPGKLPPRSQVAAKLGVHPSTVARAYRELTDPGAIYLTGDLGRSASRNKANIAWQAYSGARSALRNQ